MRGFASRRRVEPPPGAGVPLHSFFPGRRRRRPPRFAWLALLLVVGLGPAAPSIGRQGPATPSAPVRLEYGGLGPATPSAPVRLEHGGSGPAAPSAPVRLKHGGSGPAAPSAPAVPDTAVVWNRDAAGVYAWDGPGGRIRAFLENGTVVTLMENWAAHGGVPFGEMLHEGRAAWLDMRHVHRLALPANGFLRVSPEAGAALYDRPSGNRLAWLSPGTPLLETGSAADGWLPVRLLVGGQSGWLRSADLAAPGR